MSKKNTGYRIKRIAMGSKLYRIEYKCFLKIWIPVSGLRYDGIMTQEEAKIFVKKFPCISEWKEKCKKDKSEIIYL